MINLIAFEYLKWEDMDRKRTRILCIGFILIISSLVAFSQNAEESLNILKENIGEATIKDKAYNQTFQAKNSSCIVSVKITDTDKQETEEYEFNLSDLNEYKIDLNATRQSLKIECETRGRKNVVRVYEDGKIKKYTNSFEFYATDVDNGKLIVEELKKLVAICSENQNDVAAILGDSPEIENIIDFLKNNIAKVEVNERVMEQTFTTDNDFNAICTFEIVDNGDDKSTKYVFNAADINPSSIDFETKNEFVYIEGQTNGNNKLISVFENGEKQNYTNKFSFYVEDIEAGRKMKNVFEQYVKKSADIKSNELEKLENLSSLSELNDFFTSNLTNVPVSNTSYKQSFSYENPDNYIVTFTVTDENKGETESYQVNLIDLNLSKTSFDTSGDVVKIETETSGRLNLVHYQLDGESGKYTNKITLWSSDIENARILVESLKKMITKAKEIYKPNFVSGVDNPTKEQCLVFLNKSFSKVVEGDDAYELELKADEENSCKLMYKEHDVSKDETNEYKFDLADINVDKLNFDSKGQEVKVHFEIKGGKKYIEIVEQGTSKGYDSKLDLKVPDIESARLICEALKVASAHCNENSN